MDNSKSLDTEQSRRKQEEELYEKFTRLINFVQSVRPKQIDALFAQIKSEIQFFKKANPNNPMYKVIPTDRESLTRFLWQSFKGAIYVVHVNFPNEIKLVNAYAENAILLLMNELPPPVNMDEERTKTRELFKTHIASMLDPVTDVSPQVFSPLPKTASPEEIEKWNEAKKAYIGTIERRNKQIHPIVDGIFTDLPNDDFDKLCRFFGFFSTVFVIKPEEVQIAPVQVQ